MRGGCGTGACLEGLVSRCKLMKLHQQALQKQISAEPQTNVKDAPACGKNLQRMQERIAIEKNERKALARIHF